MYNRPLPGLRTYLPMLVPLLVGLIGSGWIMLLAIEANQASECSLEMFGTSITQSNLLKYLYPAAWREYLQLKQISSECIANLHREVVLSYIVIAGVATIAVLISLPFVNFLKREDIGVGREEFRSMLRLCVATSLILLSTHYIFFV